MQANDDTVEMEFNNFQKYVRSGNASQWMMFYRENKRYAWRLFVYKQTTFYKRK